MRYSNDVTRYIFVDIDKIMSKNRDEFSLYKDEFEKSYELIVPDKPMYLDIEVNNYCNMRCKMCVKSFDYSRDGKENMDVELFREVIRQGASIGVPSYFLGGFTECLINPNIREYLQIIKSEGKSIDDVLITNGYALTEEIIDLLIDLKWEKLFVSLDACKPETYRKIRGKDLNVVERNIDMLIQKKKEKDSVFPLIRVSFVVMGENKNEREDFYNKWKNKVDIIDFQPLYDYSNVRIEQNLPNTDEKCSAPFNRLYIDYNGDIYPCCTEYARFLKISNIRDTSIKEVWNSKMINELRYQIINNQLSDICKSCFKSMKAIS